jgi:hypothetical protein
MPAGIKPVTEGGDTAPSLITKDEMKSLVMSGVLFDKDGGTTREQLSAIADWAEGVRWDEVLLKMCLAGELSVRVKEDGEAEFRRIEDPEDKARVVAAARLR